LGEFSKNLKKCWKRNPSKIPFFEKIKMLKKGPFVVESFVIVCSFDYNGTQNSDYMPLYFCYWK
jgi:hypothetical protein